MLPSFFIAGFEGATGFDRHGRWFDQVAATGHDLEVETDYRLVAEAGFKVARECVRWPLVDRGRGHYDFSTVQPMVDAARRNGVTVIWDLFHFGYPAGANPLSAGFAARFADYCEATARFLRPQCGDELWVTPVNEPSYFAFAAGECKLFAPYGEGQGPRLKYALVQAAIAGIDAIRAVAPQARFLNVDPVCRAVAPFGRPDLEREAAAFNGQHVFEAWDMLAGRRCPELGGSPAHLDVVGINYYWTNQWELDAAAGPDCVVTPLDDDDPRRVPLSELVATVMNRYGPDVIISETSHLGGSRAAWLREIGSELRRLSRRGLRPGGLCLYPIMGMTDWHDPGRWLAMGLWETGFDADGRVQRHVHSPMLDALRSLMAR